MRKLLVYVSLCIAAILPQAAQAQNVIVIERTERWTIVEYNQVIQTVNYQKPLPDGYMHFTPVGRTVQIRSDGVIICREMKNAISFGKRLWLGFGPDGAVDEMRRLRGGDAACGYKNGLVLTSTEVAIRGDDAGRRIHITKWLDRNGVDYYTGVPCRTRYCT